MIAVVLGTVWSFFVFFYGLIASSNSYSCITLILMTKTRYNRVGLFTSTDKITFNMKICKSL